MCELRGTGAYRTPAAVSPGLADRLLGRRDAWCYWRIAQVVWWGSRQVRAGRFDDGTWAECSARIWRIIEACGGKITVEGMTAAQALEGSVVYVANHMSMLETVLLPCMLLARGPVSFVVKQPLLDYPLFGAVLRSTHPVAVGRENPREDLKTVLEEGMARLAAGRSVVIFPQATRSTVFDPARFNTLGVKLARRAGVPVVPLALKTDFLGVGRWLRDFGPIRRDRPVRFRFAAPLAAPIEEKGAQAAVVTFIRESLAAWMPALPAGSSGPGAQ